MSWSVLGSEFRLLIVSVPLSCRSGRWKDTADREVRLAQGEEARAPRPSHPPRCRDRQSGPPSSTDCRPTELTSSYSDDQSYVFGALSHSPAYILSSKTIPRIQKVIDELKAQTPEAYGKAEEYWDGQLSFFPHPSLRLAADPFSPA